MLGIAFFNKGKALGISERKIHSIKNYFNLLAEKDREQYIHSCNVAILGLEAGKALRMDPKELYFAGALHDIGKLLISNKTINADPFKEEHMDEMRKHPEFSYILLRDLHPFSAEVALRHHKYQPESYPLELPYSQRSFSETVLKKIENSAKIISVLDFYEACSRRNNRNGQASEISSSDRRQRLSYERAQNLELIDFLYDAKVLV